MQDTDVISSTLQGDALVPDTFVMYVNVVNIMDVTGRGLWYTMVLVAQVSVSVYFKLEDFAFKLESLTYDIFECWYNSLI